MKRGFLLSKEPKPGTPLPKIKIPSGPLPSTEVPSMPPGGDTDPVLITTLPHNTFPGEPKTECLLRPQREDPQVQAQDHGEESVDDDHVSREFKPTACWYGDGRERENEGSKYHQTVDDASCQ